jgi:hypothetical protein
MNLIEEYHNAYPKDYCNTLIRRFENMIENGQFVKQSSIKKNQDSRVAFDWAYHHTSHYHMDPDLCAFFYQNLVEYYSSHYAEKYKILETCWQHTPKGMSIQRTGPGEGYHSWHCENADVSSSTRILAYTLYLNDIDEGGETEFLYQGIKIKPETGKLVIWPAYFTHPHRGNPIYKGFKYIVSGWFTFDH